ncbi:Cysteine-rich RLK (RECEPTOR-like protein kinase) 14, putative isoform 1 [Hibiscus syriacus]|uniref:Cysteine-rich RLK (RECEPTOR-like protein kinase) 14, putative isoform 1 n=1 Tax=Hibiscus syriacus TaxID=106335 RepID=A0A6A2Z2S5_HIBSY|nr:putative receptor-like protein kinase At4g00960 [Hibiscus syriacus]KAE8686244.1 Cysteine-rich RLK (RECEPTOR-like protein kinase) 14, putative isoform 1 [Hibiscus syriacus]
MAVKLEALSSFLSYLLIGISLVEANLRCYDTGNFTVNSTYAKNRDLILSSLLPNVSAKGGFLTESVGQNSSKVYGLGMCRGDSTPDGCYTCLNSSIHDLIASCPNQKVALSWGGDPPCIARYSNRPFVGILELEPTDAGYNTGNIPSNLTEFDTVWERLMDSVARKASNGSSALKYATGEAYFDVFLKIYALMQCTPDLSDKDCDSCLRQSVAYYESCCHGKQGGYVQKPNCWFRWDLYTFYLSNASTTASTLSPPPSPASPPPLQSVNTTLTKRERGRSSQTLVIIVVPIVIFGAVIVILAAAFLLKRIKKTKPDDQNNKNHVESLQFNFNVVRVATENFADANLLGRGGFGSVYKGKLEDGRKVAIKRLSGNSAQGEQEFKNEVMLLAKLQHRNLVRLHGFSMEQRERVLIYEFLPNSSLDKFIFDPVKRLQLNWEKRYKIIEGIARGLLYLHEDSQYRIVHRDLKAANILLDEEMNPKISDFGMAKLFVVDQTQTDTSKIAGTFGYMAPEYACHGQYSVKSDVYAFGVLVLEIITGQKINSFSNEAGESLLIHAWRNWNDGAAFEVVDPILRDGSRSEIMRCIHLGLLSVQENISHRPTMASVILILSSYSISLPVPSRPAFVMNSTTVTATMSKSSSISNQSKTEAIQFSVNEASISELDPR